MAHLAWADAEVLRSLREAKDRDPAVVALFGHVLGAEAVWLARVEGHRSDVAVWPALSLDECEALSRRSAETLAGLVRGLTESDLTRSITYVNSAGLQFTSTIEDILLHVCMHGSYHRGQIARALRQAGQAPAPTDYIGFIRGAPAAGRVG
jgi:uncharacterized damage-inducible protein DinB